jgi:hypothetical protein
MMGVNLLPLPIDREGFQVGEKFAYIVFAALLFMYAFISDLELDLTSIGFGHIDPFFTLGVLWITAIFSLKTTIAKLQRKSSRGMSDEWKGPLTDFKPKSTIGQELHNNEPVVNDLAIFPTGGTSKPSVQGFAGVRYLVFPLFYSVTIGGHIIIMTKMKIYRKYDHGDIMQHIMNALVKMKRFTKDHTRVAIGEFPDGKWATWEHNEWIVKRAITENVNLVEEAATCRTHNDLMDESYRLRNKLGKIGTPPPEPEGK